MIFFLDQVFIYYIVSSIFCLHQQFFLNMYVPNITRNVLEMPHGSYLTFAKFDFANNVDKLNIL